MDQNTSITPNSENVARFLHDHSKSEVFEKSLNSSVVDAAFRGAFISYAKEHPMLMACSPLFHRTMEHVKKIDLSKRAEEDPTLFELQGVASFFSAANRIYDWMINRFPGPLENFEQQLLKDPQTIAPLLREEKNDALYTKKVKLLCAYAEAGVIDLKTLLNILEFPLMLKSAELAPELLIDILSIRNSNGCSIYRDPQVIKGLFPLFERLAAEHPKLFVAILSIKDSIGLSFYSYLETVQQMAPFLKKIKEGHPELLLEIIEKFPFDLHDLKYLHPEAYKLVMDVDTKNVLREFSKRNLTTLIAEVELFSTLERRGALPDPLIAKEGSAYFGSSPSFIFQKIDRSIRTFAEAAPHAMPSGLTDFILEAVESAKDPRQSGEALFDRWKAGAPILINAGFRQPSHYVSILVWENKFIITNRGDGLIYQDSHPQTSLVYTFDPSKFSVKAIHHIQAIRKYGEACDYLDMVQRDLQEMLGFVQTEQDLAVQSRALPPQVISNCGMANAEGGIKALISLYQLRQIVSGAEQIETGRVSTALDGVDNLFTNWKASFLLETLTRYLLWVKNPENRYIPDFKRVDCAFRRLKSMGSIDKIFEREYSLLKREWKEEAVKMKKDSPPPPHYKFLTRKA